MILRGAHKSLAVKTAFFIFAVLILPLIVLEILARMVLHPSTPWLIASNDPQLIYELNPQFPEINSLGMRQAEFDPTTLHDKFVIAVIGDSHSFSRKSKKWENSFPARLEYHLKVLSGQKVKVLNLGVPGYDMHQELEVFRVRAMRFRPDLVILQYCINDEHISKYIQPKHVWLNRTIYKSVFLSRAWTAVLYSELGKRYILGYIEKYLPDLLLFSPGLVGTQTAHDSDPAHAPHPPRTRDQVPIGYWDFIGRANLERDVRAFGQTAREAGIPIVATGFIEERDRNLYETSGFQVYSFFRSSKESICWTMAMINQ
jgi:hypothetical protein